MKKFAALILAGVMLASTAIAAEYPKMNIRLSHNQPIGSPEDIGAQTFKKLMEEKSGGNITVDVFPQMQLGSMREQTEMVQMGTLEMSVQPTSVLTPFVEELSVIDFPFLWADSAELYRIMDGDVGQKFFAFCQKKGFKTLGLWASGFKQLTSTGKPINSPDDVKGMKIRVMPSPQLVEQYKGQVAAIILEPVCFNMGCSLMRPEFIHGIRKLCDAEGICMIMDEVITGKYHQKNEIYLNVP